MKVQIVIEIDEERFDDIQRIASVQIERRTETVEQIIAKGIVLPNGHGRLIDGDKLFSDMQNGIYAGNYEEGYEKYGHILNMDDCLDEVEAADTIIPADKDEDDNE